MQGKVIGLRHLGSATLEMAYVAAGRLDGMWQRDLAAWDLAAGIILLREAGGFVADCDSDRSPLDTGNIVAANADLLPQIKRELAAAKKSLAA